MSFVTKDEYCLGRLGSWTVGGGGAGTVRLKSMFWRKSCSNLLSGQCKLIVLWGLANAIMLVPLVGPIPLFLFIWSGQYPKFDMFGLANTHNLVCCFVFSMLIFGSVWLLGYTHIQDPKFPYKKLFFCILINFMAPWPFSKITAHQCRPSLISWWLHFSAK